MEIEKSEPGLWVYHQEKRIGQLSFNPLTDEMSFKYDEDWSKQKNFFLSPHIRFETPPLAGAVTRFFENLLPEGEGLVHLAQMLKVSKGNIYALIAAIGAETTGALTLTTNPERRPSRFRLIERSELSARIKTRRKTPITTWDGKPRLSLAGVQEKLPVVLRAGQFGLGEGDIASTHILKFGNEKSHHLVINEYFCMQLAHSIGLEVAACELLDFDERVLLVKRFDRKWQGKNQVQRFHIIDGCQALDLRPNAKYERLLGDQPHVADFVGPATFKNMYAFCLQTRVPAKDQLKLLQWVFFNLLIGNCDNHIKNLSFFVDSEGLSLSPFYDLVAVSMYPDFEQAMAFHIGDTFILEEVNFYHFAEMASELNLNKTFFANQLKKICRITLKKIEALEIAPLNDSETKFLNKLRKQIKQRAERFLDEAPEIAKLDSI